MGKRRRKKETVPLLYHVEKLFEAKDKAVELALETVKQAADRSLSTWLAIAAIVVSVAFGVYSIAKGNIL